MLNKILKSEKQKVILSFISVIIFVYILLFEFVLPANGFLPKPSILLDSIIPLLEDYNFVNAFLITFTAIYTMFFISYLVISFGSKYFVEYIIAFPGFKDLFDIGRYFIPLFLVFLFEIWFGNSIVGEYLFLIIIIMGLLKITVFNEINSMKQEFVLSAKSLGMSDKEVYRKIVWRYLQPKVFETIKKNHISVWALLIVYELVCKTDGLGNIFYLVNKYNDLSVLLILITFLIISFLVIEFVLNRIKKRFFFWD